MLETNKIKDVKINWKRELHSTNVLNRIEEYVDTYWDDEYKLWKIRKEIALWRGKEIDDLMETDDPIKYLLSKRKR